MCKSGFSGEFCEEAKVNLKINFLLKNKTKIYINFSVLMIVMQMVFVYQVNVYVWMVSVEMLVKNKTAQITVIIMEYV